VNMTLALITDEIRDALGDSGVPAGLITLKTRSGRVVLSDVTYLNDRLIQERAFEDDALLNQWIPYVPDGLRQAILEKRKIQLVEPEEETRPVIDAPDAVLDWIESGGDDFARRSGAVSSWAALCRSSQWRAASVTEIGASEEGRLLTSAARTYHDALAAQMRAETRKYNLFLENVYHRLESLGNRRGTIPELANFIRVLCCLRLGESERVHKHLQDLSERWADVKSLILGETPGPDWTPAFEARLGIGQVLIHPSDSHLFGSAPIFVTSDVNTKGA
jgi:hypothetical protein